MRDLTHSGRALSQRMATQTRLEKAMDPALNRFVDLVDEQIHEAMTSDGTVLLAAGYVGRHRARRSPPSRSRARSPFTLGAVLDRWRTTVPGSVVEWVADYLNLPVTSSIYLAQVRRRLEESPIPEQVFTGVQDTVTAAMEHGWDRGDIEAALSEQMTGVRESTRSRIARTEATSAFATRTLDDLYRQGFTGKRWVAHHDKVTRPTHLHADGQAVDLGQTFTVGGYAMQVPADPSAPTAETANCRCSMIGVR